MRLRLGDRGVEVDELQEYLISVGLLDKKEYNYGFNTKIAVMKIQETLGYRETGIWEDDLLPLYSMEVNQPMSLADYDIPKAGDKVTIIGDAVYGGLGGDSGEKVPGAQKNGKVHTILAVSEERGEVLLKEIYSWVPQRFIELSTAVPTPTKKQSTSEVLSSIVTSVDTTSKKKEGVKKYPFQIDQIDCYIMNLATGSNKIEFGVSPETVSDNMVANFEDQHPKSRTSPFKAYSNSGPRDVSFTITLYQDYCPDGLVSTVRKLQALTLPVATGGYIKPPKTKVVIGKFLNITGVCLSVSVEWAKPYKEGVYSKADVSFSFNEIEDTSRFADEWEAMS